MVIMYQNELDPETTNTHPTKTSLRKIRMTQIVKGGFKNTSKKYIIVFSESEEIRNKKDKIKTNNKLYLTNFEPTLLLFVTKGIIKKVDESPDHLERCF